jgi:hypothetical protein
MTPTERTEPWVEVHFPCDRCHGTGKLRTNPPGARFTPGLHEPNCPTCTAKGYVTRCLSPAELRELADS